MGNAIHRMNISFTDSDWSNSLSVVNTEIDSEMAGSGTLIVHAMENGTDG